jgi:hypothetical protein
MSKRALHHKDPSTFGKFTSIKCPTKNALRVLSQAHVSQITKVFLVGATTTHVRALGHRVNDGLHALKEPAKFRRI